MSEERISVAELLARGGGSATPAGGRRRRHAGGENSITVAELTGEIPVIRDGVPADQAQADDQAEAASQQPAEQVTASPAAPQPVEEYDAEPVEVELVEGGQEEDAATSSSLASAVQDMRADADEPSRIDPAKIQYAGYTEHVEAIEVDDEPVEVAEVQEYTEAAGRQAAAQQDAARAVHPSDGTEEDRNFAWSQWTENHPPVMATADFNTALVRERQARLAESVDQDTVDVAPVTDVPDTATTGPQDTEQTGDAHTDGVIEQLVDDSATPAEKAADVAAEDAAEDAVDEQDDKSGGQSWLVLIAEVVLGLAAGAGLFYGFFKLWNWGGGMPTIALTVVLAFVVVIAIVTFTHYLRKTTDYLTLGLALLVGLVITFGPLLMSLGSN